jgi:DNA invertase Pin-like site-specific DNA recombinase/DNA-binding FrmR family transcriptional regulator
MRANNIKRAVGYLRVSTEEQAGEHKTSLPYQRQQFLNYCQRKGYEVVEVIEDPGYSGTTEKRPGLARLKQLIHERSFDVLVAYDSSRLARHPLVKGLIKEQLRQAGIMIAYVSESYDDSDVGEMSEGVMDWVNWFVARQSAGKVYAALHYLAEQGKLLPTYARLGYEWTEVDTEGRKMKGARLVKANNEEPLVHLIFDLYEQMSQRKVARWLNENSYRLPCKSPRWREKYGRRERLFKPKDISDIISDGLYTGMVVWGRTTRDKRRQPNPQRHWFPELQIISFEQFNRVQRIKEERKQIPAKSVGSAYVYSGLIHCPYCRGHTVGKRQWHPEYDYQETKRYVCRNYHTYGRVACKGWNAFEQTVTKAVIPFLADVFENRLGLRRYIEEEARNMAWEAHEDRAKKIQAEMETAKAELKRIQEGVRHGIYTPEEAQSPVLETRERIERAEKQLEALKRGVELQQDLTDIVRMVCGDIQGALERLNGQALSEVVHQVFTWFTIGKRGYGLTQKAWVSAYEFRKDFQRLLIESITSNTLTPICEIV